MSNEQDVRELIERWISAVQSADLDGILADHADDIVMYDVPPPYDGIRGIDAYRDSWPQFFNFLRQGAVFEGQELEVTEGDEVAFVHGLLRCGTPADFEKQPDNRLRLTVGLRKVGGRWLVTHEHHSFPV
jgi:uncharacterized protein (TIGR02246 family)